MTVIPQKFSTSKLGQTTTQATQPTKGVKNVQKFTTNKLWNSQLSQLHHHKNVNHSLQICSNLQNNYPAPHFYSQLSYLFKPTH